MNLKEYKERRKRVKETIEKFYPVFRQKAARKRKRERQFYEKWNKKYENGFGQQGTSS